jgi:hypothetical protein
MPAEPWHEDKNDQAHPGKSLWSIQISPSKSIVLDMFGMISPRECVYVCILFVYIYVCMCLKLWENPRNLTVDLQFSLVKLTF